MPPMDIKVGIDLWVDNKETLAFLERMTERMRDMRPAWQAMHSVIIGIVKLNFASRGRPQWPPLKTDKKRYTGSMSKASNNKVRQAAFDPTLAMWPDRAAWIAHVGAEGVAFQYGVNKTYTVPAYTRRVTSIFGRPAPSGTMARIPAHSVHSVIPPRPFFCLYTGDYQDEGRLTKVVKEYIFTAKANYTGMDSLDYGPNWIR